MANTAAVASPDYTVQAYFTFNQADRVDSFNSQVTAKFWVVVVSSSTSPAQRLW